MGGPSAVERDLAGIQGGAAAVRALDNEAEALVYSHGAGGKSLAAARGVDHISRG